MNWIFSIALFASVFICWRIWCDKSKLQKRTNKVHQALQDAKSQIARMEREYVQKDTESRTTTDKLRSYLQMLDTLINTIPNPIYYKDVNGVFLGCNRVFAKQILGLTRDRIIGKRPRDLPEQIPPHLVSQYQRQEMKMMEKKCGHTFEAPVLCHDGIQRDFLFSLAPVLNSEKQIEGSVSMLLDLTEKNRAAQDRLQKEKLEGVLETAGAVCHEMNQPLQALSGYVELLQAVVKDKHHISYIRKIQTQIKRMQSITNELQHITHYESMDYAGNTKIIDIRKASQE